MLYHVVTLDGSAVVAPPSHDGRSRRAVYPFGIMPIGSYFVIPLGAIIAKIRSAANAHKARNPGWDYQTWVTGEGPVRLRRTA